jgi:hypothetical protein
MVAAIIAAGDLPIAFVTLGFVASSTLLFASRATRCAASAPSRIAIDLIVGAAFRSPVPVFTRGSA